MGKNFRFRDFKEVMDWTFSNLLNFSFVLLFLFRYVPNTGSYLFLQGLTPPPFFPSERKGTKKAVFLVFFLKKESKIKKKVEVVAEFVYVTANKRR